MSDQNQIAPTRFDFQELGSPVKNHVHSLLHHGEPMFAAKDVALALGYHAKSVSNAISMHCKGAVDLTAPSRGGQQTAKFIPERDVYRLIMRSKLPAAEQFEEWVVGTVLPSLRKHGGYIVGQETDSSEVTMAKAVLAAQSIIAEQQAKLSEQAPKVAVFDAHVAAGSDRGRVEAWRSPAVWIGAGGAWVAWGSRYGPL